ncbi:MAG: RluA family pseudouridine synthase [Clostridiales bacterium]|nr:RluA family pseudouridine synthase [Clostridiales bacterium]
MDSPRIIFEDNHLLVAYKPVGYLSQSDGSDAPDMLSFLKTYIKDKYNKPGNVYLGLVHRLDRNVSGVMVFARTSKCASRLSDQIRKGTVTKRYKAKVSGELNGGGKLINYLVKDDKANKALVYDEEVSGAKRCELIYEAGSFNGKCTEVDIELITGRFHQIRAQFAHIGHPLLGDIKYGGPGSEEGLVLKSYYLAFDHPTTGERLEFSL